MRDAMIAIHVLGGVIAFASGSLMLVQSVRGRGEGRSLLYSYLGSIVVLLVPLCVAIGLDWPEFDTTQRIAFSGLGVLDLYMGWRSYQAYRLVGTRTEGWREGFADHIGLNLISLFEGFVIVSAIGFRLAGWLIGLIAVLGVVVGNRIIHAAKMRLP